MSQRRTWSLLESLTNITLGYFIALGAQLLIFPLFGIHIPLRDNLQIGLLFTCVSLVRSYTLRRMFNYLHSKGIGV